MTDAYWSTQKYLLDGEPITPRELIKRAADIDLNFDNSVLKHTSMAAKILRQHGHEVGENNDG